MASMATTQELLDATDAAILQCLTAQSYTISGRAKAMAQLATLKEFRQDLLTELDNAQESGGSMCSLGQQTEPSL